MLDHTGIVVSDFAKARRFYAAIAKPLGLSLTHEEKEWFLLGRGPGQLPYLWIGILRPTYWLEGSRAGINQMHVAFVAPSKEAVDDFHREALAVGGADFGKPGPRQPGYYAAFALDPDGNNIEAVFRDK
jgi:catechol 2,3-dioxygenase-like lactoylglutathione lyase family enzyme